MLLTLPEIKAQLRLDEDFTDEDPFLELLGSAVQARTESFLNRKLYGKDETIPDSDPDGLHLPDDIRLGMLLLLTHYYENRSSVSEVEKSEMPLAYNWLVGPYRFIPL
ncbi:head-tail connector protein [Citrobacter amalonaticus]|uniref:head-tail connector protein n=1 Tax=Citrobacter amalonaticus TaxID=35703 RepID=UPI00224F2E46|nr:head-tail connector protein [Citrobacter amalonaticus]MCX3397045.1 head-tail connector protein [Citrobacter amalonaticus]MDQ2176392.1 head-tail connector protein [Citrobacter amalonaticus]